MKTNDVLITVGLIVLLLAMGVVASGGFYSLWFYLN